MSDLVITIPGVWLDNLFSCFVFYVCVGSVVAAFNSFIFVRVQYKNYLIDVRCHKRWHKPITKFSVSSSDALIFILMNIVLWPLVLWLQFVILKKQATRRL